MGMTAKVLTTTEDLLRNRDYSVALSSLEAVDTSLLSRSDYGLYCILLTEARAFLGIYEHEYVDEAIEVFRYSSETKLFARAKYVRGWLYSLKGKHREAKQELLEAYANYLRCNDNKNAAKVLNRLAYGSLQTGDTKSAIENLEYALQIHTDAGNRFSVTRAAHNLAYVLWSSGCLSKALAVYAEYGLTGFEADEKLVLSYSCNCPIPYALKGDIREARKRIARCKPYLDTYKREKAIYFENLGKKGWNCRLRLHLNRR
jgi:tetratricopeptide (TPR) repeat protein